MSDVIIVGAGMAGLACAVDLADGGIPCLVLEASDGVGGRVRTDVVDGYRLDRGFQVYLTAYPEGRRVLDYGSLGLRSFRPGAVVMTAKGAHRLSDPLRRPSEAFASLRAPVGSLRDKAKIGVLGLRLRGASQAELLGGSDVTTAQELASHGFSTRFIDSFLRPLFAGIQLDPQLESPARMFRFVFGMLARGAAAVPARGMQAIPDQLAARLPEGSIRLGVRVTSVDPEGVELETGERLEAAAVVVATDGPAAARLTGIEAPGSLPVTAVYHAADRPPSEERSIVLNGTGAGPINNMAVLSNVAPSYAPRGKALIVSQVLGSEPGEGVEAAVREQLAGWYGPQVDRWRHLRTYHIPHAQPAHRVPFSAQQPVRLESGVFVAGDHRATASINGAISAGRRAASAARSGRRGEGSGPGIAAGDGSV